MITASTPSLKASSRPVSDSASASGRFPEHHGAAPPAARPRSTVDHRGQGRQVQVAGHVVERTGAISREGDRQRAQDPVRPGGCPDDSDPVSWKPQRFGRAGHRAEHVRKALLHAARMWRQLPDHPGEHRSDQGWLVSVQVRRGQRRDLDAQLALPARGRERDGTGRGERPAARPAQLDPIDDVDVGQQGFGGVRRGCRGGRQPARACVEVDTIGARRRAGAVVQVQIRRAGGRQAVGQEIGQRGGLDPVGRPARAHIDDLREPCARWNVLVGVADVQQRSGHRQMGCRHSGLAGRPSLGHPLRAFRRNQLSLDRTGPGQRGGLQPGQDLQRGQRRRVQLGALGRVRTCRDDSDGVVVGAQGLCRFALGEERNRQIEPRQRRPRVERDGLL